MKLNDPNRNRKPGFFGVTVATLLTPGGKLFTSAMAAVTTLGVVGVVMAPPSPHAPVETAPAPKVSDVSIDQELLNVSNLEGESELMTSEAMIAAPEQGMSGVTLSASNHINVASVEAMTQSAPGGIPAYSGLGFNPPSTERRQCTVVKLSDYVVGADPDKEVCLEDIEDLAKNGSGEEPPVIVSLNDPESGTDGGTPPKGSPALNPQELITPEDIPSTGSGEGPTFQPAQDILGPIQIAAVSEPSTLAMLLLGLVGLGSIARRKAMTKAI